MPPRLPKPPASSKPSLLPHFPRLQCLRAPSRSFSATPCHATRLRRDMYRWLNGPGAVFKDPLPGSTNYLNAYNAQGRLIRMIDVGKNNEDADGDSEGGGLDDMKMSYATGQPVPKESQDDLIPFPLNRQFKSQPVLSEELKDEIWSRVMEQKHSVRYVSAELGVEMRRVGAVVRLKSVEKEWIKENKKLANPYAKAVQAMLPTTPLQRDSIKRSHESINDLPVHKATQTQLFHPVSESRAFTRADAGEVFLTGLLPADARIPHPELIDIERPHADGQPMQREEKAKRLLEATRLETVQREEWARRKTDREEAETTRVVPVGGRWEFRFRDVSVESVGKNGRDKGGVGARYGHPHEDRKRGQIKIPRWVD